MKKIFRSIQFTHPGPGPMCDACVHFQNDPSAIEDTYRGLRIMSSGFASVRDHDGFCDFHQLYLSARDSCPDFKPCGPTAKSSQTM